MQHIFPQQAHDVYRGVPLVYPREIDDDLYREELKDTLGRDTVSDFRFLLLLLTMPLPEAEAFVLNVVTSGSGAKERLLYPTLLGRTNEELSMLKALTAENSTGSVDRNTVVAKTFSLQAVDQAVAAILANLLVQAFADGEPGEQWLVAGSCVAPVICHRCDPHLGSLLLPIHS
ncbi:hypothetical protein DVH05_002481 [Phytophthora capsici]|nr:hypothetical protein DVH05_002481 [Phytophthora capsici]